MGINAFSFANNSLLFIICNKKKDNKVQTNFFNLPALSSDSSCFVSLLPIDCCSLISTYLNPTRKIQEIPLPLTMTKIVPIGRSLLGCSTYRNEDKSIYYTLNLGDKSIHELCITPGSSGDLALTDGALFAEHAPQSKFFAISKDGTKTTCEMLSCKVSETTSITWTNRRIECVKTDGSIAWKIGDFHRFTTSSNGKHTYGYFAEISRLFISKKYEILAYSLRLENEIHLINIKDGSKVSTIQFQKTERLWGFCMNDNGTIAALTFNPGVNLPTYKQVKIFDISGHCITEFGTHMRCPSAIAILPEGTVAVVEQDKISVWG